MFLVPLTTTHRSNPSAKTSLVFSLSLLGIYLPDSTCVIFHIGLVLPWNGPHFFLLWTWSLPHMLLLKNSPCHCFPIFLLLRTDPIVKGDSSSHTMFFSMCWSFLACNKNLRKISLPHPSGSCPFEHSYPTTKGGIGGLLPTSLLKPPLILSLQEHDMPLLLTTQGLLRRSILMVCKITAHNIGLWQVLGQHARPFGIVNISSESFPILFLHMCIIINVQTNTCGTKCLVWISSAIISRATSVAVGGGSQI